MLRARIIPCLLIHKGGLVKTVQFGTPKYVGDPLNAVRIFNEKEVDELVVLDIDASVNNAEPNYTLIESLARECRMPLCYGGGVKTADQVQRIISLGAEKVAISSAAVRSPDTITKAAERVGNQSLVVVLDVKRNPRNDRYEIFVHNGKEATGLDAVEFAQELGSLGAGEIVVNVIEQDGMMAGYDLEIARRIRKVTSLPMTLLGGAGKLSDIQSLIKEFKIVGAAAGSLFVFKGVFRAVLINYPNAAEKEVLFI